MAEPATAAPSTATGACVRAVLVRAGLRRRDERVAGGDADRRRLSCQIAGARRRRRSMREVQIKMFTPRAWAAKSTLLAV